MHVFYFLQGFEAFNKKRVALNMFQSLLKNILDLLKVIVYFLP